MKETRFYLIRHGETDANLNCVLQGQMEFPLNELGRKQAACAAEHLREEHFDCAFSSDLGRAMETARIILSSHPDVPLYPEKRLREWNCGKLQGRAVADINREFPGLLNVFRDDLNLTLPEGESRAQFQARVSEFLTETARTHAGEKILLIAHGGTLQRIFNHAVGVIAKNCRFPLADNASIGIIRHISSETENVWQLVCWNSRDHLSSISTHELFGC